MTMATKKTGRPDPEKPTEEDMRRLRGIFEAAFLGPDTVPTGLLLDMLNFLMPHLRKEIVDLFLAHPDRLRAALLEVETNAR